VKEVILPFLIRRRPAHRMDRQFPQLKGTIFIVTYGRTGSTLLQRLLMTIPDCTIRGENHNLLEHLWKAVGRADMARSEWGWANQAQDHPWFGADKIAPPAFAEAVVDAFVQHVLAPPKASRWFGFKEIRYNASGDKLPEMLDFIRANFKNATFVFNSRNAADVAASAWWKKWRPENVAALVALMDTRFADYAAAYPDCCFHTRYEDFTADPQALRPLFDRLGEPFDADALGAILKHRLPH
jgi:hypothetical protein